MKERRGTGENELNPIRIIPQIYSLDGELLMEQDPEVKYTLRDLVDFGSYCKENAALPEELIYSFFNHLNEK